MLTHLCPVGLLAGVRSRTGTKSLWSENVPCDRQRDRPRDGPRDRPRDRRRDRRRDRPTRFLAALGVHQLLPMLLGNPQRQRIPRDLWESKCQSLEEVLLRVT